MTSSSQDLAQALWPPDREVMACEHSPTMPMMCWDHMDSGLLCDVCLITHIGLKHNVVADNIPEACSLCETPIAEQETRQAQLVAERLGVLAMRTAHDVYAVVGPTVPIHVLTHERGGVKEGLYDGPIRLWGNAWLCDRCRAETPPDTLIAWEISPAGVANSPDEN
jgi:hypothetical protein